jgi:hypothetical protein
MRLAQRSLRAAEYWLVRANEAGLQAEQTRDRDALRELLQLVEDYLRMAMLVAGSSAQDKRASSVHRLN